jgi:hypothetical protein
MYEKEKLEHFPIRKVSFDGSWDAGWYRCWLSLIMYETYTLQLNSISTQMENVQWLDNPFTLFLRENRLTMKKTES